MAKFDIEMDTAPTPLFEEGGKDDAWCEGFLRIRRACLCSWEPVKSCGFVADSIDLVTYRGVLTAKDQTVRVVDPVGLLIPTENGFSLEVPCACEVFEHGGPW